MREKCLIFIVFLRVPEHDATDDQMAFVHIQLFMSRAMMQRHPAAGDTHRGCAQENVRHGYDTGVLQLARIPQDVGD